jgi:hypothetical protein
LDVFITDLLATCGGFAYTVTNKDSSSLDPAIFTFANNLISIHTDLKVNEKQFILKLDGI